MHTLEHYRGVEFERWATRAELEAPERAVIDRWVVPGGATVEAGTGGGCVLHELRRRGHARLEGFDLVPEMIASARRRDASGAIGFRVADAVALPYRDGVFDQALYLRAILCAIEDAPSRRRALREANRILRPGGRAIFAVLCLEGRRHSAVFRAYAGYLSLLRRATRSRRGPQEVPWLRRRGRPNPRALLDLGPHVHWFRVEEAAAALAGAGFRLVAGGSARDAVAGTMHGDVARIARELDGPDVFLVCEKAAPAPGAG